MSEKEPPLPDQIRNAAALLIRARDEYEAASRRKSDTENEAAAAYKRWREAGLTFDALTKKVMGP